MMSTNQVIVVTICTALTSISGSDIRDCPAADRGILFTSEPSNVEVCGRDNATFYCRYEGSTANPDWIINFTSFTSADLPPNHSFSALDGTLSVTNIMANQNNTQYRCQLLSLSGGQLCAYRSTVGRLIIRCRNKQTSIIPINDVHFIGSTIEPTVTAKSDLQSIQSSTLIQIELISEASWHFPDHEVTTESPSNSRTPKSTIENVSTSGLTFSVAIALGLAVILVGIALLVIPIGLIVCLKNKTMCQRIRKANQENIYDEPSQPDPVYQEVTAKPVCTKIEMMENCSYMTTRLAANSVTVLQQCPAYVKHENIRCT